MRHRPGSGPRGQLVDPRNGQRRVVHQAGKTWRTVDTEDIHEKTHQDEHGELVTETARTAQQEQFQNIMVSERRRAFSVLIPVVVRIRLIYLIHTWLMQFTEQEYAGCIHESQKTLSVWFLAAGLENNRKIESTLSGK